MDPVNPWDPNDDLLSILQRNFLIHYRGNRSPFGVWLHPAFLMGDPQRVDAVNRFVEWTMRNFTLGSVWYTTGSEVIDFMRRPAPIGAYQPSAGCTPRAVAARETVCDGLDDNGNGLVDEGLVTLCSYPTASFRMCGECPAQVPTFLAPQPPGAASPGSVARVANGASATQCAPIAGGCRGGVWNAAMCACECARVTWSADAATRLGGGFCADSSGLCTVARVPVSGAALFEALQQNSTFIAATSFYDIVRSSLFAPGFQKFLLPASVAQSLVPALPSALAWSDAAWLCPAQAPAWLRESGTLLHWACKLR
jgi:hypothetical protein